MLCPISYNQCIINAPLARIDGIDGIDSIEDITFNKFFNGGTKQYELVGNQVGNPWLYHRSL